MGSHKYIETLFLDAGKRNAVRLRAIVIARALDRLG